MTDLTRRSLLHHAPIGAAALGALPAASVAASTWAPHASRPVRPADTGGSMIVHLTNPAAGELTFLVGAREFVIRDMRLVANLLDAVPGGQLA